MRAVMLVTLLEESHFSSFILSFAVLQLMLLEAPQAFGFLYYTRIGHSNFLHQFRAATPLNQRKLEL
jgi:hypothetical protein